MNVTYRLPSGQILEKSVFRADEAKLAVAAAESQFSGSDALSRRPGGPMSNTDRNGEQGLLVLRQDMPLYGRFSLLVSDAYCVEVKRSRGALFVI